MATGPVQLRIRRQEPVRCGACGRTGAPVRMTSNGEQAYCGREGDPGYVAAVAACTARQEAARAAARRPAPPKGPGVIEQALGRVADASADAGLADKRLAGGEI